MNVREKKLAKDGYHHGDLRAGLIEATRRLVEEKGPEHLSVSQAARLAGVSTAAPYKHFKDKDDLLRAVAYEGMGRQFTQMQETLAPLPLGSMDRIVAMGHVYVDFAKAEPAVFRLMFGLSDGHEGDELLIGQGKQVFGFVQMQCAQFRGSNVIEEQDVRRAFQLWSFVHGLSFLQIDGKLTDLEAPMTQEEMLRDISERVMGDAVA